MKLNIKNKQKKIIKIYKYVAIEQQQQATCTQESIQSNTHNKLLTVFVNFKKLHTHTYIHTYTHAHTTMWNNPLSLSTIWDELFIFKSRHTLYVYDFFFLLDF